MNTLINKNIFYQLYRLWRHISKARKNNFYVLLGFTILASAVEIINLGLVAPFMMALSQPDNLLKLNLVNRFSRMLNIQSNTELVVLISCLFGITAVMANGMRLLLIWMGLRAANTTGAEIATDVFRRTLYQPYHLQVAINSSEIVGSITLKTGLATGVLIAVAGMLSSSLIFIAFLITILAIDIKIGVVAVSVFGLAYLSIGIATRKRLRQNSFAIAKLQVKSIKMIQEGLGSIRDITLDGSQKIYCDAYSATVWPLQLAGSWNTFIGSCPRFVMEALGMMLVTILTLFLYKTYAFVGILPMLGTLAVAANRMLPLMQQIYGNWVTINGNVGPLNDVLDLLNQPLPTWADDPLERPLGLSEKISFENVGFKYLDDAPWVLSGVNLSILKGARTGFIGATGSGKSTFLDLLMGLLNPTYGQILIDGMPLDIKNLGSWQRSIAHVPQSIYLIDGTIAQNIAFGIPVDRMDHSRIREAARQAQIAEFIESRPESYDSVVGERGIRISGGQRQRIGIARALYKQASILVFDEATSALDNETEQSVMEAIEGLSEDLTILIIAHRTSTLRNCNQIIFIEDGKVRDLGAYGDFISEGRN